MEAQSMKQHTARIYQSLIEFAGAHLQLTDINFPEDDDIEMRQYNLVVALSEYCGRLENAGEIDCVDRDFASTFPVEGIAILNQGFVWSITKMEGAPFHFFKSSGRVFWKIAA